MITEFSADPVEIRFAGTPPGRYLTKPVLIASGQGVIPEGTVLAQFTSGPNSGKFGVYADGGSNGLAGAVGKVGLITEPVDATNADVNSTAYVHGLFRNSLMPTNLTTLAKALFPGWQDFSGWDGSVEI